MNKKVVSMGVAAGLLATSFAMSVFAEDGRPPMDRGEGPKGMGAFMSTNAPRMGDDKGMKMGDGASIQPNGDFRIAGVTVNSVDTSGNTITGTAFGFTKTVNVGGATIWCSGNKGVLGDIQSGDKIMATGNWNASTRAVVVKEVRDPGCKKAGGADNSAQIQAILKQLEQLRAQLMALKGQQ